jgi:aspartyl-tRNA(Asn)/glutamyl-tRNA(Gln) amidotransferase subunit B
VNPWSESFVKMMVCCEQSSKAIQQNRVSGPEKRDVEVLCACNKIANISIMTTNKYIPTIGLEIHAELKTASKMFCSCKNDPDEEKPNTNICPICLGHPGTLPVLNESAIKKVLEVGIAVNGKLADFTEWDRKNYFYPDIPKGYQISQYKYPMVQGGVLAHVEIERVHLEEDTAQSTHDASDAGLSGADVSLINFNRAGVPLLELVTKPVIHDAETAVRFAKEFQLLLRYLGASDANMEKGEMRVEANISVSSNSVLGTKTEVKNLNSFKVVEKAIAFEIVRQSSLLDEGGAVKQETRGWDDVKQETYSQRSKESSHDYRYFPDPDIPKMKLSEIPEFSSIELRKSIPELPWIKRDRYQKDYGMTDKEVAIFIDSPAIATYFDAVISSFKGDPRRVKLAINYILSEYLGLVNKNSTDNQTSNTGNTMNNSTYNGINAINATSFGEVIELIAKGDISSRGAKDLLALMMNDAKSKPRELAEKHSLIQKSNAADLIPAIEKVLSDNPKVVTEYKAGKTASLQFLIGQAMKATKGAGNPEVVKKLLLEKLS